MISLGFGNRLKSTLSFLLSESESFPKLILGNVQMEDGIVSEILLQSISDQASSFTNEEPICMRLINK